MINHSARYLALVGALVGLLTAGLATAQSLDQLSGKRSNGGLKAALDKGAASAVASLGRPDGFWANPKVKIPCRKTCSAQRCPGS
jgi:hypothetical protein